MQKMILKFSVGVIFAAVFLFLPCPNLYAEPASGAIDALQQKYDGINTLSADFTQEVFSKGFSKPQVSGGKVYFKKPGKMKWLYSGDAKDELVSSGATVWFYQSDLNQVMERAVDKSASNISTDFLSGVGNLKKDFIVQQSAEKGGLQTIELTPRAQEQSLKKLFLTLDKKTGVIVKTAVEDHFGGKTVVSFKNIKTNTFIKDSFFEFTAPKGASVVRQ